MWIDIVLSLLLLLIPLRLAYLGVHITMHPIAKRDEAGKIRIKREFWALAIVASLVVVAQGIRNGTVMESITKSREGIIRETRTIPALYSRAIKAGQPLAFDVYYRASNDVSKVKSYHEVFVVRGERSIPQENDMYLVAQSLSKRMALLENGVDEAGNVPWHLTASSGRPLTQEEESGIVSGQYVVFIVGFTQWQNPSGSSNSTLLCEWLDPNQKQVIADDAPWHFCRGH
jgi:hypothetical protein